MSYIRQDAAVIQTLHDFGVGVVNEEDISDSFSFVQEAMMMQSHIMAAPAGGLSTALFRVDQLLQLLPSHLGEQPMTRPPQMYSNGHANSRALGPDRDINAATDDQLELAGTRPITRSLPFTLGLSTLIRRYFYST